MKKKLFLSACVLYAIATHAQVGILTPNPQGAMHVDGAKDNSATGAPTAAQQANDFVVKNTTGNVGVGTTTPSNKVHIVGNGTADPLRVEGLIESTSTANTMLLTALPSGLIRKTAVSDFSIPQPAIFRLNADMGAFLNGVTPGGAQGVNMVNIKNTIPGLTYSAATRQVSLPPGIYHFSFVYEAVHNNSGCTISSYFVDFPEDNTFVRVHNNSPHIEGGLAIHGGALNYTAQLTNSVNNFTINLGRGQSGNCTGPGMRLLKNSTHLLIYRLGD